MRAPKSTILLPSILAAFAVSCAGPDPMTGTWHDADATTPLPAEYGGGLLNVDATLALDGDAAPSTFGLHLRLEYMGLSDVVDAQGTYEDDGSSVALTFTGFTIDPASGNTARVADDGSQCITQMGFGGAEVCFPVPQTASYALDGDALTLTVHQAIAPAELTDTQLTFTRVQ